MRDLESHRPARPAGDQPHRQPEAGDQPRRQPEAGDQPHRQPEAGELDGPLPVSGLLDIRDDHGLLRVEGYLPSPRDVYVPPAEIRRYGLRPGDVITGTTRTPPPPGPSGGRNRRDRHAPLVRLDTVNGLAPEQTGRRPEFYRMTPLHPRERLRLETGPQILTTRVLDLLAPIGKGQRALVVAPPKAGKTLVLHAIAQAVTANHPECHLMAVLIDERPEEVTDMRRTVEAEIVAATFDRPPADHIAVAELAIERAKRLVESGRDVVVLLDSLTRLGRAYNLAAPAGGRVMSGGIEAGALHAPKRFLGAARNLEHGGSLTIIATALVETGSVGDTVIFEEFKSTGNSELRLLRAMADRRIFPAVDLDASGTRREDLLLTPEELPLVRRLRRALHGVDSPQRGEQLLDRLQRTASNAEFLLQLARSTPPSDTGRAAARHPVPAAVAD